MLNKAKKNYKRSGPLYKFGVEVPRNIGHAYQLDKDNGNTNWANAIKLELENLQGYETFIDKGIGVHPEGYKKIIVHFVFDVKHDLRH